MNLYKREEYLKRIRGLYYDTMIGSAVEEIGFYKEILKKATSMLSDKGELFYSCVTKEETKEQLIDAFAGTGAFVADYQRLEKYGLVLIVSKIT